MNKMPVRKTILVCAGLFITSVAFCQTEVLKSVVNNLAFYKQKNELKYLSNAKRSVDSLTKTHADSLDLGKSIYRALVNSSILYIDSLNKLQQPADLFNQTVDLVNKLSNNQKIYKFQTELDFSKRCLANVYIRKGFKYIYNSDFSNAEQVFQRANKYAPSFTPLNAYIAYTNSKLGNLQAAAKFYHNLVNSDSTKAEYIELAVNTYELIGDTAKALEILKKARKVLPTDKFLVLDEANIYNNQKDYRSLASLIKSLLDINPNNSDIAFVAANCYDHLSEYDKAESLYLHAIDLNATAYDPIFNLGLLYLKQSVIKHDKDKKNLTYAAQWLEKANEISPNDLKCLQLLQLVYAKTGNENQMNRINNKLKDLTN
jgi:tetratricopeptide (TPR) repeat protein